MQRVHVRCGSDIFERLDLAGIEGAFFEFSDPVCQGPLPNSGYGTDVLRARSQFISSAYRLGTPEKEQERLQGQYALLDRLDTFDEIILWFEHDLYDQSILIRFLANLAHRDDTWRKCRLVDVGNYVGTKGFFGLGNLEASDLARLEREASPITFDMVERGADIWGAFCSSNPEDLFQHTQTHHTGLPWLSSALLRHIQELPWTTNGLSLTEQRILEAAAKGDLTPVRIFRRIHFELEPAPYLGDIMFWHVMDGLASAQTPALTPFSSPCAPVTLTDFGHELLYNAKDFLAYNTIDRWWGGLHLTHDCWRYDGEKPTSRTAQETSPR